MHLAIVSWLALLALALTGCQGSPASPRPVASGAVSQDASELAAAALGRGDYTAAAELYRSALREAPDHLPLHYGLGVSASYLDRRTEAIREFTWVVSHGNAASDEVRAARRWFASVGALPRAADATMSASEKAPAMDRGLATVSGRVTFDENPGVAEPVQRMQLFLHDYPNRVVYHRIRTDEHGRFRFPDVPPGLYKVTDRAAGAPRWRLRVELTAGQDMTLDLNRANSTKVRDDFPDSP